MQLKFINWPMKYHMRRQKPWSPNVKERQRENQHRLCLTDLCAKNLLDIVAQQPERALNLSKSRMQLKRTRRMRNACVRQTNRMILSGFPLKYTYSKYHNKKKKQNSTQHKMCFRLSCYTGVRYVCVNVFVYMERRKQMRCNIVLVKYIQRVQHTSIPIEPKSNGSFLC